MGAEDQATAPGSEIPDPDRIGGYPVIERLAVGRSTIVYLCDDDPNDRRVVAKMMKAPFDSSIEEVSRFLHSARGAVDLKHPNVVEVLNFGQEFDRPYLICELVEGEDIRKVLGREGALRPHIALDYARQAATGLRAAFNRGLLHGDVRPGHFLLEPGCLKVTGFGLSPALVTAHGRDVAGDPAYLAPEFMKGSRLDHRSDIYSLGCTLFEMLTARTPYGVGAADALLACHLHEPFPRLAAISPHVSSEVDDLVRAMAAKNPNSRPQSYEELLERLEGLCDVMQDAHRGGPRLVVEIGRQPGVSAELPEGELLLGRSPDEGFFVDDGRVSRRHALMVRDGNDVIVRDLGSRNGIKLNGERVQHERPMLAGDRLALGDTVLVLVADEISEPVPQAANRRPQTSPVRGAYGEKEVAHPPQRQAGPDTLSGLDVGDPRLALAVMAAVARVFAVKNGVTEAARSLVSPLAGAFGADGGVYVRTENGRALATDAKDAAEAEVLSCVLPAIERAIEGQLALATVVKVGRAGVWGVALAPVRRSDTDLEGYLAIFSRKGRFGRPHLSVLETACALLSARARALISG
jgi:hypothetical protein